MKIHTLDLVDLLKLNKKKQIEVSIKNHFLSATHFLSFGGKKIYDVGIDSKQSIWEIKEFIEHYKNTYWNIDQILF